MKKLYRWLRLTSLSLCFLACSPPKTDPAVLAYRELVTQLTLGSPEGVWAILSSESQQELTDRLGGGRAPVTAPSMLALELDWAFESPFVGQARLALMDEIRGLQKPSEKERPNQPRFIQTIYASQSWLIPVLFESGQWRVHLLGAQQTSPPQ